MKQLNTVKRAYLLQALGRSTGSMQDLWRDFLKARLGK